MSEGTGDNPLQGEPSPNQNKRNNRFCSKFPKLTNEEIKVLRECNQESFYQRSLPLSIAFGLTAYYGVSKGYLKPNSRFGAVPKVILGVFLGHVIGKWTYRSTCIEKMKAIPNSRFAERLQARKDFYKNFCADQQIDASLAVAPFSLPFDTYTDEEARPKNDQ